MLPPSRRAYAVSGEQPQQVALGAHDSDFALIDLHPLRQRTTHGAAICGPDGRVIGKVPAHPIEPDLPTAGGILRPELHTIVADRVRAANLVVCLGVTVDSLMQHCAGPPRPTSVARMS